MAEFPIYNMVDLMITEAPGGAVIEVLGGENCAQAAVTSCKKRYAARLSIGGKIIGMIPADQLSDEQLETLSRHIRSLAHKP